LWLFLSPPVQEKTTTGMKMPKQRTMGRDTQILFGLPLLIFAQGKIPYGLNLGRKGRA
jgi:hypothetical protein